MPASYNKNRATPVLFSFHGNGKNMAYQATLSRFTESAINPDMLAVFPQGLHSNVSRSRSRNNDGRNGDEGGEDGDQKAKRLGPRCWQGAPYCTHTHPVSDVEFVGALLDYMREHYCVDDQRIYASGKSIGGGFVDVLACSASSSSASTSAAAAAADGVGSSFAAFAMDAAAVYTEANDGTTTSSFVNSNSTCHARRRTPILELHGTNDTRVPYGGGESHNASLPSIRRVLGTWALRNGCLSSSSSSSSSSNDSNEVGLPQPAIDETRIKDGKSYAYTQYDCAGHEGVVVGYNVTGQGHVWISRVPNAENHGVHLAPVDASEVMMDFFNKWTL